MLLTIAYTSLAAVLTRSMIASLVIGLVVTTAEQTFFNVAAILSLYAPDLVRALSLALPAYHLDNLAIWIGQGRALPGILPDGAVALPWTVSLAAASAWILGLGALTLLAFRRQDIN